MPGASSPKSLKTLLPDSLEALNRNTSTVSLLGSSRINDALEVNRLWSSTRSSNSDPLKVKRAGVSSTLKKDVEAAGPGRKIPPLRIWATKKPAGAGARRGQAEAFRVARGSGRQVHGCKGSHVSAVEGSGCWVGGWRRADRSGDPEVNGGIDQEIPPVDFPGEAFAGCCVQDECIGARYRLEDRDGCLGGLWSDRRQEEDGGESDCVVLHCGSRRRFAGRASRQRSGGH